MHDDTTITHAARGNASAADGQLPLGLIVVYHPNTAVLGQRCALRQGFTLALGRASAVFDAEVLGAPGVSRRHAEIEWPDSGPKLRDLASHNGTFLNGERVVTAELRDGDVIGMGDLLLLVAHFAPKPKPQVAIVAESAAMRLVLQSLSEVASTDATILITGATGTGKELVARALHQASQRRGALVAVNCGALAEGVLASELFGHRAGAFSGAAGPRQGLVESAKGGTLFLDEIGDASLSMQAALLRLLESHEYRPVGDDAVRKTDARFVAATHVDLGAAVATGRFRADLLGRLSRHPIHVAPLSARRADIVPIALAALRASLGPEARLDQAFTLALLVHPWPLNTRELLGVVERAGLRAACGVVGMPRDWPSPGSQVAPASHTPDATTPRGQPTRQPTPRPSLDALERAFAAADGNMRQLAENLGVSRATLYRWVDELGTTVGALRKSKGASG